jgi:hypothetical protein
MDDEFRIRRRRIDIQAVHWNGTNHDEVRRFFAKCGLDPVDGPYFDSPEDVALDGYNTVKANLGDGDDDFEASAPCWISYDEDLPEYDTWGSEWFERTFDCS